MTKNARETKLKIELISKWYKNFGIDHLLTEVNSINNKNPSQENKIITSATKTTQTKFNSLEELRSHIMETDVCGLKNGSRNTVFSGGDPKSDIMIIGEAPGQEEDLLGEPFVGQSGKLLDNMLKSVGLSRKDVYITNIVFWRPPGNRTPSADEISVCMPYVHEHIKFIQPKVLLLLGGVSVRAILNTTDPISKLRGKKCKYKEIDVIPTFHPAYLLRSPNQKALSFCDMINLKKILS